MAACNSLDEARHSGVALCLGVTQQSDISRARAGNEQQEVTLLQCTVTSIFLALSDFNDVIFTVALAKRVPLVYLFNFSSTIYYIPL